jgi:hypothetical protein
LITRETVIDETPEARATSLMVTFAAVLLMVSLLSIPQNQAVAALASLALA